MITPPDALEQELADLDPADRVELGCGERNRPQLLALRERAVVRHNHLLVQLPPTLAVDMSANFSP